ncbi:hypothetical protein [Pseudobutyrivibrio sp.]|uniref:hypothetical protein n=1 Tax=Pseudobutyrivibrio sp. TaxID=2014367 RepID=UPI0025E2FF0A|nr:hypothetical protein [Pseudobutyrivibrio sp.]
MGLFSRKKNEEAAVEVTKTPEKKVDIKSRMKAIKEVGRFSIEQKNKLQQEEANTIQGIETIRESFAVVEDKYGAISESVANFQNEFKQLRKLHRLLMKSLKSWFRPLTILITEWKTLTEALVRFQILLQRLKRFSKPFRQVLMKSEKRLNRLVASQSRQTFLH